MNTSTKDRSKQAAATRKVSVGSASGPDSRAAGHTATLQATGGEVAELLVVLSSPQQDPVELMRGVNEAAAGASVIGCTTAGEIVSDGLLDSGVVVIALLGEGFSVSTGLGVVSDGDIRTAAATASRCIESVEPRENTVLLLLSDGLGGDQQEVVRGAYQQVGAQIPLVGGCAGDDGKMIETNQFFGNRVCRDSIVAAAISSDGPIGVGVSHGWRPVGEPMTVTSSDGVVVHELDGRPALDVYLERLEAPMLEPESFTDFAATRPLGLSRRGREEIRFVATADYEARTLHCFAGVPQGGLCWSMSGDSGSILRATDEACGDALDQLGEFDPMGLVAFDCIARKGVLGTGGVVEEIQRLARHRQSVPVAGFYTYGEFARVQGATGFHNQTLVVLAFG